MKGIEKEKGKDRVEIILREADLLDLKREIEVEVQKLALITRKATRKAEEDDLNND